MRSGKGVIALVLLAVVFGFGVYLARQQLSTVPDEDHAQCTVGKVSLDQGQLASASTIAAVGIGRELPEHAIVIALATALQESKLRNLQHLGSRNDHDSVGLFQQRPSQGWGTEEQLLDPRFAANAFFDALLKIEGWDTLRITEAAQRVQKSAYPEAYEKWADEAQVLAGALTGGTPGSVECATPAYAAPPLPAADHLRGDFGDAAPTVHAREDTLVMPVADTRSGWQVAHWLVAQADVTGVTKVAYRDQEWSADNGTWVTKTSISDEVTAQVLPAR